MGQTGNQPEEGRSQYAFNLALAAVAGQVGCLTLVIVIMALFGGLWLDSRFQTRPMFTILLMVGSVPVTLVAMFWVVRKATARIATTTSEPDSENVVQEETDRGAS